ncbi:MAG: penicillin acylase family protein, partial [Candidatus Marinimicrobia bacterium]|nr:penicillin acylase family protein [Candidatus Neomarinimicrobiota bacterium]
MRHLIIILIFFAFIFGETKHLIAPDGTTVIIDRDEYGVPHIKADNEAALFFGQGFAEAYDRLYQIDLNRRAGAGRLSEWFGSLALDFDKDIRKNGYTKAELNTMLGNLSDGAFTAVQGYVDGVNAYVDTMNQFPEIYKPSQYASMEFDTYTIQDLAAFTVYMLWDFGKFGGNELSRLNELQNNGWDWFNENRPINDPGCSTTIPDSSQASSHTWHYSGMTIPEEAALEYEATQEFLEQFKKDYGLIYKFGSFATLVSPGFSSSGNVMLLGCPQMGAPVYDTPSITMELELECPTIHVGGMSIPGIPFVVLGHNEFVGWTWTSGISDNVDTYIDSTQSTNYNDGYWHNNEWLDFEVIVDTIKMIIGEEIFTHYRTIHGPVVGAYLPLNQVYSHKMTFWMEELHMAEYIYQVNKVTDIFEYETFLSLAPMSFNCFVVDQDQNIGFWHSGRFQDRSDGVHPYLPHKGDGSEEWGGFIAFEDLPQIVNPDWGYFTNWNNKPAPWWNNGDSGPWITGSLICQGVDAITDFVSPFSSMT